MKDTTMHLLKRMKGLLVVLVAVSAGYTGYKVSFARRGVEQYRRTYGYRTPTTDLGSCTCQDPSWKRIPLDSAIAHTDGAHNIEPFDIDTGGEAEIIASEDDHRGRDGTLHLYTCSGDPGNADDWRRYDLARFARGRGINVLALRDMDRDGNPDIVAANHQGDVFALRNPGSEQMRGRWDTCLVTPDCGDHGCDFREIDVGNIDLDGDEDIIVADERQNAVVWFANPGAAFRAGWRRHLVDRSDVYLRWCHCVRLGDVDKDGDLDVAVAAAASNVFLLYLNQRLPGHDVPIATAAFGD